MNRLHSWNTINVYLKSFELNSILEL